MDVDGKELQVKAHKQIAVLTAVSANLIKETEEIDRQRQVVEEQIQSRYEAGVRLLEESRHTCLLTLKAATQQVKDKVQAEMDTTVAFLSILQAFADDVASGPRTSASKSKQCPPLLSDAALRHFQHLLDRTEKPAVFSYTWSHNMEVVTDSVREFMGSVSVAGVSPGSDSSRTDSKERSSAIDTQPLNTVVSCFHAMELLALRSDLTQLRQDLVSANDQLKHLTSANEHLKQDLTSATDQFKQDLTSANYQLKEDLRSTNDQLQYLTSVTAVVREMKNDVSECERDIVILQQSQTRAESQTTELREQIRNLNTPVLFNTRLSYDTYFPKNATVVMDKVLTNTGGGYDAATGVFTAPQTGTYLFMATGTGMCSGKACLEETGDRAAFQIMVEGKPMVTLRCMGMTSSSSHTVVRLESGHKVWLQVALINCHLAGGLTCFCGLLTQ